MNVHLLVQTEFPVERPHIKEDAITLTSNLRGVKLPDTQTQRLRRRKIEISSVLRILAQKALGSKEGSRFLLVMIPQHVKLDMKWMVPLLICELTWISEMNFSGNDRKWWITSLLG